MNELQTTTQQLPDTIEDLSKFVLVNEERIQALRAEIRAIKKVSLAKEVYEQKLAEAQEVGQMTVEAAQKMGELLLTIQKQSGARTDLQTSSNNVEEVKTKTEITSEMGMTKDQVSQYQQMAQNPEAVQAAIQKAIERGDVVSRSQVMKEIREMKEKIKTLEEIRDAQAIDKRALQRRVTELENTPPKTVYQNVEPSDYKEAKSKARAYDAETNRLNQKIANMAQERNALQEEIKELQKKRVEEQAKGSLLSDAIYFISKCGFFIQDVAGYVWLADKLKELPDKEREQYVRAASAVRDWSVALLQSIERDEEYGKPEIRKLINESAEE